MRALPRSPTPRADCWEPSEFSDWFTHPLSPAADENGLSELFPGAQTSWPELDSFSDLFPCPSQLEGTFSNNAPLSPPATDDWNHFDECSDIDDPLSHYQDAEDNRNDKNHGEDGHDEDDVVFISSQPIQPRDSSSPIKHEDFPDTTQNHRPPAPSMSKIPLGATRLLLNPEVLSKARRAWLKTRNRS
ncbi:hypothetical protein FBULB1_13345 [Fusarium bulbicola]|nr:hypothetical protein FBULB1_13345 [Fusarium bulbicola]